MKKCQGIKNLQLRAQFRPPTGFPITNRTRTRNGYTKIEDKDSTSLVQYKINSFILHALFLSLQFFFKYTTYIVFHRNFFIPNFVAQNYN